MREIKFKAKRVDNEKWVFGVPVIGKFIGVFMVWTGIKTKGGRGGIVIGDRVTQAEVIPETVCQYTGLKDKNGKEIYEGDILIRNLIGLHGENDDRIYHQNWQEVFFENGAFVGKWFRERPSYGFKTTVLALSSFNYEFEIIGNIYDNPELLKGE